MYSKTKSIIFTYLLESHENQLYSISKLIEKNKNIVANNTKQFLPVNFHNKGFL